MTDCQVCQENRACYNHSLPNNDDGTPFEGILRGTSAANDVSVASNVIDLSDYTPGWLPLLKKVENYVDTFTDGEINEFFRYYDDGGHDHLMKYPHSVAPRKDVQLRRGTLIEYMVDCLRGYPDDCQEKKKTFGEVVDKQLPYEKFYVIITDLYFSGPLMHRLNQGTRNPDLGDSPLAREIMKKNLVKVIGLLESALETQNSPYVHSDDKANDASIGEALKILKTMVKK